MSGRYILALDQGTSSSRAALYDARGQAVASERAPLATRAPRPGWAEQDATAIWESQRDVARALLARCDAEDRVLGVGIANQRETVVVWDRASLEPVGPAISWQCRRTAEACRALAASQGEAIRRCTGLVADAYFSGPKIAWLLDHAPGLRERAARGELAAGTVDAWLLARLTEGRVHATDVTNASRTLLYDIHRDRWDEELCAAQGVPLSVLPAVQASAGKFGTVAASVLGREAPVLAMVGDQQSALVGQGCTEPGPAKVTYGTGAFLLTHSGPRALGPAPGLLTTRAASGVGERAYALEGSVFSAGSAVEWLAGVLGMAGGAAVSALASEVEDSGGVSLVPAQYGLGSPHWQPGARTLIGGVSAGTSRAQLARAALEGVAFRVREVVEACEAALGREIEEVRADGGLARSEALMQIQADALGRAIVRPGDLETTSWGAALLAGQVAGLWAEEGPGRAEAERRFEPGADLEREYGRWRSLRAAAGELGEG